MASVSSLSSSSSSSSIYGNRNYNIISGLASGMDTEEMISGLVQSYQQKIQSLQQKNTKYQWQQEAYQSISDKLVEFYRNYSSYVYSNTNLASSSFFSNAVITSTSGKYSNFVTASGKSSSDITLNAVKQLASAARYTVSGKNLSGVENGVITGGEMSDLSKTEDFSKLSGSLTLNYGDSTVSIELGDQQLFVKDGSFDADGFQNAIVEQLKKQEISTSSGKVVTADQLINVTVDGLTGTVSFSDKSGAGNSVSIDGATGNLATMISGLDDVVEAKSNTFRLNSTTGDDLIEKKSAADYLSGKSITVTLDGQSKTIDLTSLVSDAKAGNDAFVTALNKKLAEAFGSTTTSDGLTQQRVSVALNEAGDALSFTNSNQGSTLSITTSNETVGSMLGIGSGLTSYVNTTKTLGDLGIITGDDTQELWINDVKIGTYTKDTELNTIINDINANTEAGVSVSYSKTSGQFVFTAKDTGAGGRIDIKEGGLAATLFGATVDSNGDRISNLANDGSYKSGDDAKFIATINGQTMELTRSSNSFDIDGMNITVSGVFNKDETVDSVTAAIEQNTLDPDSQVTFTSKTDADTIVDAVKKMVEDLNTIIKEVKSAYSDMPLEKSDGSKYEPLTDEDMEDMSESAIENYEEKAKTGILFMDSDLSSLYNDLRSAISSSGADGATLRSIGINVSYSDGLSTISFDEKAFREALESDPDKVQEAFTKSRENGAATDGLMASLTAITDKYAATSGSVKGILIEKAGSKYSPTAALDNTMLDKMNDVEEEISKWQEKMSNQVDYYTNKFTQLEMLINQMNSQSSALSGLMGG